MVVVAAVIKYQFKVKQMIINDNDSEWRTMNFQEPAIIPSLAVYANIEFSLKIGRSPVIRWKTIALYRVEMVLLLTSGNAYIDQLFSEMKQPLAIARASTFTPKILLINERFAALGICTKQKIFQQQLFQICQTMKKIRHLLQLNNLSIVHAITEKNSHQSREFEGNGIQDIKIGENKIAARSAP